MRRKIALAASAALLIAAIATPATATADETPPFDSDLSSWLAPGSSKPAEPKQDAPTPGEKASDTPVIAELAFAETQHG